MRSPFRQTCRSAEQTWNFLRAMTLVGRPRSYPVEASVENDDADS
jgi:hypothetical protein